MKVKNAHKNLVEDVKKTLTDPIYNVTHNFSLEKSREFYDMWVGQFDLWYVEFNPAVTEEFEVFEYDTLEELQDIIVEAKGLLKALIEMPHTAKEWYMVGDNEVVVTWLRLKTYDEWLDDWLEDALYNAISNPYGKASEMLEDKLGLSFITAGWVDAFVEEKVSEEALQMIFSWKKKDKESVDMCDDCFMGMIEEIKRILKINNEE